MARIIGYIVIGIIALVLLGAIISIAFSIFGLVFTLLKFLLRLAVFGAIIWFAWQLIERVRQRQ